MGRVFAAIVCSAVVCSWSVFAQTETPAPAAEKPAKAAAAKPAAAKVVKGKVTEVGADMLVVEVMKNKVATMDTFYTDAKTVVKAGAGKTLADVKAGEMATVKYSEEAGKKMASSITVAAAKATKGAKAAKTEKTEPAAPPAEATPPAAK